MTFPTRSALATIAATILALLSHASHAAAPAKDPHYNEAGFFDIHVCNWPDQPMFLMALFSTTRHDEIRRIDLIAPDGTELGPFNLERHRPGGSVEGKEKRIYITNYPVPTKATEGWYLTRVTMKDGSRHEARDNVVKASMPLATGHQPPDQADKIQLPIELRWNPVPGAKFYQVFIRDEWESEKMLLSSPVLTESRLILPAGLIKPGGSYVWRVHARDINGDPEWGDFNHGSTGQEVSFSVAD